MPREVDPGPGAPIGLDELVEALDASGFDPRDSESLVVLAPWLARLGRDRRFLADLAIAALKERCAAQIAGNSYGAQVLLLRPPNGRYTLRAAFWPAAGDAVVRASGTAPFFYGMAHDHNFSFLTVGYLGPGYWSDYYEYDGGAVVGLPGEDAGLRFVERSRLHEGRVLLYRAHRDVHAQHPPDSFSVSLNILAYDPAQVWRTQYRFDLATGTIAEPLTTAPSEVLAMLAVHLGGGAGLDLAHDLARRHPVARMRTTATAALASAAPDADARLAIWGTAAGDPDPLVAGTARIRIAALAG